MIFCYKPGCKQIVTYQDSGNSIECDFCHSRFCTKCKVPIHLLSKIIISTAHVKRLTTRLLKNTWSRIRFGIVPIQNVECWWWNTLDAAMWCALFVRSICVLNAILTTWYHIRKKIMDSFTLIWLKFTEDIMIEMLLYRSVSIVSRI